jgi:hypothetical protein
VGGIVAHTPSNSSDPRIQRSSQRRRNKQEAIDQLTDYLKAQFLHFGEVALAPAQLGWVGGAGGMAGIPSVQRFEPFIPPMGETAFVAQHYEISEAERIVEELEFRAGNLEREAAEQTNPETAEKMKGEALELKMSSLEQKHYIQDARFQWRLEELERATKEEQQVKVKDLMATASSAAAISASLITIYREWGNKEGNRGKSEQATIEDQKEQIRQLKALQDGGDITRDEFELMKSKYTGLTEAQRDAAVMKRRWLRRSLEDRRRRKLQEAADEERGIEDPHIGKLPWQPPSNFRLDRDY